ncbi:MAG: threonine-phosphate decarboxylase CobD [Clostridiales bacterium]
MCLKTHGGDIYSYIREKKVKPIDFSANINPMGLPKDVKKCLKNSINSYESYPDIYCNKLVEAISLHENVRNEQIVCGNGAADIIYRMCYAIHPKKALLIAPTFSEYEAALKQVGCEIQYYVLKSENEFKIQSDILNLINGLKIVFICNPNNPTGMLIDNKLLYEIAIKCRQINSYLIIDECFLDFTEEKENTSFKKYLCEFDHLVILKAFTKSFAMAGLRLGYCISSNVEFLKNIYKASQPWSVSTPAQIAGVCALKDKEYINKTIYNTAKERKYLTKGLKNIGLHVFESYTNFILFKIDYNIDLYGKLYEKGILIRKCNDFKELDNRYFRIAVKSHRDNIIILKALNEIINKG